MERGVAKKLVSLKRLELLLELSTFTLFDGGEERREATSERRDVEEVTEATGEKD